MVVFVPFLGDFLSMIIIGGDAEKSLVFVPFLGDFLSIYCIAMCEPEKMAHLFSSPFLGTFFQSEREVYYGKSEKRMFSSPFLGTFFQFSWEILRGLSRWQFSSPFLGTFFQLARDGSFMDFERSDSFRPLSWGLSFNMKKGMDEAQITGSVFVPFLGDFLSIIHCTE